MKDTLITFETASLAKTKGFKEVVNNYFRITTISNPVEEIEDSIKQDFNKFNSLISRPIQSLLQKWLREVHKIEVIPQPECSQLNSQYGYNYYIWNKITGFEFWSDPQNCPTGEFTQDTYEEALEAGLQEALKLLPNV